MAAAGVVSAFDALEDGAAAVVSGRPVDELGLRWTMKLSAWA
jgi:hypothetical protein